LLAASGWVEYLILQAEPEELLETIEAVGMLTWCLPVILWRQLIVAGCALKVVWRCRAVQMSFVLAVVALGCVGLLGGRDVHV
jgi:hypothetical protein